MKIKAVLFDLDGTLLPMDLNRFLDAYFGLLAKHLTSQGFYPKQLIKTIWSCTEAMIKNDGSATNETIFWNEFSTIYGKDARRLEPYFEEFYREDFDLLKSVCGFDSRVSKIIKTVRASGIRTVLATSPLYPAIATRKRAEWAGLASDDFELITTYENSYHTKPNPAYYLDILKRIDLSPKECLMVGNDVEEDMVAETIGMNVFLLTDCLINKYEKDISLYPNGSWLDLQNYLLNM